MQIHDASVLFITLDSCRYDTFKDARTHNMRTVGPFHKAMAPSYFTFGSHVAMFVGFTPGVASAQQKLLNPKYGRIFGLETTGIIGRQPPAFRLPGPSIIVGFSRLGYATVGTGAVRWFDPQTETGKVLAEPFEHFFYPGNTYSLLKQLNWILNCLETIGDRPAFVFLNVGETHTPYYFEGAPWSFADNPCVPFQRVDRSLDCRIRQTACLEYADRNLAELLNMFSPASIIICGDHGDCWGEDGLWEHGISHEMALTVPLILRLSGQPIVRERKESLRLSNYFPFLTRRVSSWPTSLLQRIPPRWAQAIRKLRTR